MLTKTIAALEYSERSPHVISDPQIKQLLAQHLIVLLVAETEDKLEEIIVNHFKETTTEAAQNLAKSCLSSLLRSIKTSEIAGFLGRLGDDYKNRFQDLMLAEQAAETRFNNLVVNRHSVVHEAQCNVTFEELQQSIPSVRFIFDSLERALANRLPVQARPEQEMG